MPPGQGQPPHDQRIPPVINVIALATFSAACRRGRWIRCCRMSPKISAITIATAAGFSAAFAFTFAIIQPVLGAAADLFGKTRLM